MNNRSKCFHSELRRARDESTDAYMDVWYCPEPGCGFEIEPVLNAMAIAKGIGHDYSELLMAVERKFPDETRHQTALRYIREAENRAIAEKGQWFNPDLSRRPDSDGSNS